MGIPLITTTIGSFPKPAYTPIRDWFDSAREKGGMNSPETTRNYKADLAKNIEKNEMKFEKENEDFDFNQDAEIEFGEEFRSPGWNRLKKNKFFRWKK